MYGHGAAVRMLSGSRPAAAVAVRVSRASAVHVRLPFGTSDWDGHATVSTVSLAQFKQILVAVLSNTTTWGKLRTQATDKIGFDSLPMQVVRRSLWRGFSFNIIVVGASIAHDTGRRRCGVALTGRRRRRMQERLAWASRR